MNILWYPGELTAAHRGVAAHTFGKFVVREYDESDILISLVIEMIVILY